jgi:ElaB/YqjD/DUF883 family membrane-anchored ribosome-binding protein
MTSGGDSASSSRQIQADIDRTRAHMDRTFDALESKLTPGQLLSEGWDLLKGGSGAGARKLFEIAREHPLPSAVIGLGLGLLVLDSNRQDRERRARASHLAGPAKDKMGDLADQAKETLGQAKEKASDLAGQAADKVSDLSDTVREQASELGDRVQWGARKARLGFWQLMEERPLVVGAATLAVGLLVGLSIPSTEAEDELMGETRDQLLDRAQEGAREVLDKGKEAAGHVADRAKQVAEEEGLTPDKLADKVKHVAQEATETAKNEAGQALPNLMPGQPQGHGAPSQPGQPGQPRGTGQQPATQPGKPSGQDVHAPAEVHEPELVKR